MEVKGKRRDPGDFARNLAVCGPVWPGRRHDGRDSPAGVCRREPGLLRSSDSGIACKQKSAPEGCFFAATFSLRFRGGHGMLINEKQRKQGDVFP